METLAQGLAQGRLARWAQALRLCWFLLNYGKFIHLCDGYPVFSLATPALFSTPAAHFIACTFSGGIQNRNLPNLLSLAISDGCHACCDHCSLPELRQLIRDAQQLGVSILNLVGGEPLLRPDLPEIIASFDKSRSTVVLLTNGWHLAERAPEMGRAGTPGVFSFSRVVGITSVARGAPRHGRGPGCHRPG